MLVIKRDGSKAPFDPSKIRKWIKWSVQDLKDSIEKEYEILTKTLERLAGREVSTEEIHETIITVCLEKEQIEYSRIAANLELATILKNQERQLGLGSMRAELLTFTDYVEVFADEGIWVGDWVEDALEDWELVNEWFVELDAMPLEYWTVKQWSDKYSLKVKDEPVETPAMGALANAFALHGVTETAFLVAKDIILNRTNYPTPMLNGCRNGDFNSISCCVIEGGDTVDSLEVSEHIASSMTARKAGIGITLDTRSKGDPVKSGQVKHLGKQPLFKSVETTVKKFTQLTRGGSATMTVKCIDPDIMEMLLWKTQRIDLSQRIDKIDYSLAYNDSFVHALLRDADWYLFGRHAAPEVHDAFYRDQEAYDLAVSKAIRKGVPYKKVKALDVLIEWIKSRWETGRLYCINVTSANEHTPFTDPIHQSNLCMEIMLPTVPYVDMQDLYSPKSVGETAFCSLAALNVAFIPLEEYFDVAYRALLTVDTMIEKAAKHAMSESMRRNLLRRRSIGIGITGLASYLYKNGLDYNGSNASVDAVEEIAEMHYYALLKASQTISKGEWADGIKKDWLPIDTMRSTKAPLLDWESLRGIPRKHSVLVAHMPTESSAVFSNATNGVYPSRDRVVYKKARRGKVQFISQYFVEGMHLPAWSVDMVPYYAAIQAYTDQAISADYYTDFTQTSNNKVKMEDCIEWFVRQAISGVKTCYYQNFREGSGEEVKMEETCSSGGCKL